jgi:hypothetical protein
MQVQVNAAQTITSNVLTTMTIFNTIVEANQHARADRTGRIGIG